MQEGARALSQTKGLLARMFATLISFSLLLTIVAHTHKLNDATNIRIFNCLVFFRFNFFLFFSFFSFIKKKTFILRPKIVGYTIAYFTYTSDCGKSFFLEDLYVQPQYRNHGVGRNLFKVNVEFAVKSKCRQMLWHVLGWNTLARDFYHKLEAEDLTTMENGLEFYRLDKEKIEEIATRT